MLACGLTKGGEGRYELLCFYLCGGSAQQGEGGIFLFVSPGRSGGLLLSGHQYHRQRAESFQKYGQAGHSGSGAAWISGENAALPEKRREVHIALSGATGESLTIC